MADDDKATDKDKSGAGPVGADPSFKYRRFAPERRLGVVQARQEQLETRHYERRLDMLVARNPDQSAEILNDVDRIEQDIADLRDEEAVIQQEIDAATPAENPA